MTKRLKNPWIIALLIVAIVRIASLGAYPLTDTTEARYGEIARVMATSGNWVTPQLEVGVPFWAKPPLSFWQTATSMILLGVSEFSARLPSLLNMLLVLGILYLLAYEAAGFPVAAMSMFITLTTVLGFVAAGAVMTDAAMLFSTTLAMASFWWALERRAQCWGYIFFIALALGLLAKGPVAWVLTGVPLIVWMTIERRWRDAFRAIPLIEGSAILGLTALPWFLIAEIETPGFLHYFFVGEHLQRYLDSGWAGDRYGNAHDEPRGTIWLFGMAAFAPWSLVAMILLLLRMYRSGASRLFVGLTSLQRYLLLWCLWPLVFFTMAGNILPTYVLPGLPAFALLLAIALRHSHHRMALISMGLLLPVAVSLANPLGLLERLENRSQSATLAHLRKMHPTTPVIYVGGSPHSARFYSQGTALFPENVHELELLLETQDQSLLIVRDGVSPSRLVADNTLTTIMQRAKYTAFKYTNPAATRN